MRTRLLMLICLLARAPTALLAADSKSAPPVTERFHLSDLLPRGLQKNPRLNLSIITELTEDGKAVPAPTKAHPAYYVVVDGGLVEAGDLVAGEKPPAGEKLARMMQAALAESGYQPATKENPPTLVVVYRWGSYNHLSAMSEDDTEPDDAMRKNFLMRASLVGGGKFATDLLKAYDHRSMGALDSFRSKEENYDLLVTMAESDLYFILAVAYDGEAAKHSKKKILWTTKLSTDSQGLAMDETLPSLVANAGSYFGHETKGSVIFHPRVHEGHVEIGEATVQGYLDEVPPPKKP